MVTKARLAEEGMKGLADTRVQVVPGSYDDRTSVKVNARRRYQRPRLRILRHIVPINLVFCQIITSPFTMSVRSDLYPDCRGFLTWP